MQIAGNDERGIVERVVVAVWHTGTEALTLLGTGVYGRCYGVTLARPPYRAAIKLHHVPGMAAAEAAQLRALRTHLPLPALIPHVYACLPQLDLEAERPLGAVAMEWLPGESCGRPEALPRPHRVILQRGLVDLLLTLHRVVHPAGYGAFAGPFHPTWWDAYGPRLHATQEAILTSAESRAYLGRPVLALMERTLAHAERILATTPDPRPVLLHGDVCFGNLLVDPVSWHVCGLLDPLDAEWGERELDLVNVINGHVRHFEVLNGYRAAVNLGPSFPLRYWFYQVWKWLSYHVRVGAPCRAWVLRCGRELEKAMERALP